MLRMLPRSSATGMYINRDLREDRVAGIVLRKGLPAAGQATQQGQETSDCHPPYSWIPGSNRVDQ